MVTKTIARDLSVTLSGWRLDNPVIPASGTFGFGNEFRDFYDINILGTFSFKGTTRDARFGNPTPRIAECTAGMINAVGLQNPGIDAVIAEELPRLRTFFHKPVIANISGFSVEEYAYCADGLCLINTMLGMRIDVQRRKPVIANVMGGFSGDAVFPVALRMVYQVAGACGIPVIGCGGVSSARDVIEMMMAGATAVEVGAANLKNPYICKEIIEALPSEMERLGIERLADIVGCAAR